MATTQRPRRDFDALRRRLSRGMRLEEAAAECGMTSEEATTYLVEQRQSDIDHGDEKLIMWSQKALNRAYKALTEAIDEKNRQVADGTTGQVGQYTKEQVLDVDAAKALLRAAIDIRKMVDRKREVRQAKTVAGVTPGQIPGQLDLFESPWSFKKSD